MDASEVPNHVPQRFGQALPEPGSRCDGTADPQSPYPSIVFLDIQLGPFYGVDVCRSLRAAGFLNPVIAMTANAEPHEVDLYRRSGFTSVLSKPFTYAMMTAVLTAVEADPQAEWLTPPEPQL